MEDMKTNLHALDQQLDHYSRTGTLMERRLLKSSSFGKTILPSILVAEPEDNVNLIIPDPSEPKKNSKECSSKQMVHTMKKSFSKSPDKVVIEKNGRSSPTQELASNELVCLGMERKVTSVSLKHEENNTQSSDIVTPVMAIELQPWRTSRKSNDLGVVQNQGSNFDTDLAFFVMERKRSSSLSPPIILKDNHNHSTQDSTVDSSEIIQDTQSFGIYLITSVTKIQNF